MFQMYTIIIYYIHYPHIQVLYVSFILCGFIILKINAHKLTSLGKNVLIL